MADSGQEIKVAADIPFLFYDVIGRMFPGGFLIVGGVISWWHFMPIYCFQPSLTGPKGADVSVGLATLAVGVTILVFGLSTCFIGFILAAISYLSVERLWRKCRPYTLQGLSEFLGIENTDTVKTRFRAQFGSEPKEGALNESSFLCAYFGWKIDPTLGAMQGRWDSDLLAAQSFVLVSVMLIAMTLIEAVIVCFDIFIYGWLIFLSFVLFGSWLNFKYHRKKRVYGRFGLFLALTESSMDEKR